MPTVDLTRIGSNIGAMYSLQSLLTINNKLATHQTRLSTGKRLNSAMDDPAGLTIATKMNARSEGLKVVMDNISDAKNMLSVAESGLSKITDILTTMRSKANQAASDTLGGTERATIQTQLSQYAEQIDDLISETKWNGVSLLDGTVSKRFQTGVDEGEFTSWQLAVKHDPTSLGVSSVATDGAVLADSNGSSVASTTNGAIFTGMSKLSTGTYKVAIKDVAASDTQGNISNAISSLTPTGTTVSIATNSAAAGTDELTNGTHQFEVTGWDAGTDTLSYRFDGGTIRTAVLVDGANVLTNGNTNTGVSFSVTAVDDLTAISGTHTFDYVRKGMAEAQLQYADGTAVSVDSDGNSSTIGLATTFYMTHGQAYDTGKGLNITAGTTAAMLAVANSSSGATINFTAANDYSVNVSSAQLAASYMTTVQNAMDTVNQAMADLGSLMARMTIKEEAAATSQINVEAAYNRIMNANMAEEQVNASKYLVLQQTAVAMLAQANQAPQFLLSLFR